jgi:hypothetical protein
VDGPLRRVGEGALTRRRAALTGLFTTQTFYQPDLISADRSDLTPA